MQPAQGQANKGDRNKAFSKLSVHNIAVSDSFDGYVRYIGNAWLQLDGLYGISLQPLLSWNLSPVKRAGTTMTIWPEFWCDPDVELVLEIKLGSLDGKPGFRKGWKFLMQPGMEPFTIDSSAEGYLCFSLLVRGSGFLQIGTLHCRQMLTEWGVVSAGDRRYADPYGGEALSLFDQGDGEAPLIIHFSDFQRRESYEDGMLFRTFGVPGLTFADPRIFSGCYYIGSKEYEQYVSQRIREVMGKLNFRWDQVIFSGFGMGAYAAVHYGIQMPSKAILMTQPVLNITRAAEGEQSLRPGRFPGAMDCLKYLMSVQDEHDQEALNARIWNELDAADLHRTSFAAAYMLQDDYDPTAWNDLVTHLAGKDTTLYGKGVVGRHDDEPKALRNWYLMQYKRILTEEFGRQMGL